MGLIKNPITKKGKVRCLHYYERSLGINTYDAIICLFLYDYKIYVYTHEKLLNKSEIECFGELDAKNIIKAKNYFKMKIV